MARLARIHQNKRPIRRHFIKEWAEHRGLSPADIIKAGIADRSTVYRWFEGQLPQPAQQDSLAGFLEIEPEALLRHPDDDWISRHFKDRLEKLDESQRQEILQHADWVLSRDKRA